MFGEYLSFALTGLAGLLLGLVVGWYLLQQRYLGKLREHQVRWTRRISDAQTARDEHQARLDKTLRHALDKEQNLQQALRESEETVELLSDEKLPAYERDLISKNQRIYELEQAHAHHRAEMADAKDLTDTLTDQLERFGTRLKQNDVEIEQLSAAKATVTELENEKHEHLRQQQALQKELDERHAQIANLEQALSQRDRSVGELQDEADALRRTIPELTADSNRREVLIGSLKSELEQMAAQTKAQDAAATQGEQYVANLQRERDEQRQKRSEMEELVSHHTATSETLQTQLRDYEQRLPSYEMQLQERDERLAKLEQAHTLSQQQLPELHDTIRAHEQTIEELVARLDIVRKRLGELQDKNPPAVEVNRSNTNVIHLQRRFAGQMQTDTSGTPIMPSDSGRKLGLAEAEAQRWKRQYDARLQGDSPDTSLSDTKPVWCLDGPQGEKDDLKRIRGIGPKIEQRLNGIGIFHFAQLAGLHKPDIDWVAKQTNCFPGRIERDRWIEQARELSGQPQSNRQ